MGGGEQDRKRGLALGEPAAARALERPSERQPHELDLLVGVGFGGADLDAGGEERVRAEREVRARGVEGGQMPPVAGAAARLLCQLTGGGLARRLAVVHRAGGHLERPVANGMAVLPDEQELVLLRYGDD